MTTGELALIVAALTAAGVLLNALIASRRAPTDIKKGEAEARKLNEEADQVQVGTSLSLVTQFQAQATRLQSELEAVRTRQDASDKREFEANKREIAHVQEISDLKTLVTTLQAESIKARAEALAAKDEAAFAKKQAEELRQSIIRVGNGLDDERKAKNKLVLIFGKLMSQFKDEGHVPNLERDDLEWLDKLVLIG